MNKEWYYFKYWVEEYSLKDIAKELGICAQTVLNRMEIFGIPRRTNKTHTNTTKQKMSILKSGSKNYWFGKKRPEHSKKMKKAMKGRVFNEETRKKMSIAKKKVFSVQNTINGLVLTIVKEN